MGSDIRVRYPDPSLFSDPKVIASLERADCALEELNDAFSHAQDQQRIIDTMTVEEAVASCGIENITTSYGSLLEALSGHPRTLRPSTSYAAATPSCMRWTDR